MFVSVAKLSEICNPYVSAIWDSKYPLDYTAVCRHVETTCFKVSGHNHAARVARLIVKGWKKPLAIDVGVPCLNSYVEWPVVDGNHRLAAAMFRGDEYIEADICGQMDYAAELLGVVDSIETV